MKCAEGTTNPTITVQVSSGVIQIKEDSTPKFSYNAGDNYHLAITKSGDDLIVFAQSFDTFESKWQIINTNCKGVSEINYGQNPKETKRFMTGWADGVDPRISEILNTANVEEDGSWNVIFDKGWRSYTSPLSTKNMKFEPADYLGGESYLVVGSS